MVRRQLVLAPVGQRKDQEARAAAHGHQHAECNERTSTPAGQLISVEVSASLQEEAEAIDCNAEDHECQRSADPDREGALAIHVGALGGHLRPVE